MSVVTCLVRVARCRSGAPYYERLFTTGDRPDNEMPFRTWETVRIVRGRAWNTMVGGSCIEQVVHVRVGRKTGGVVSHFQAGRW